MSITITDPAAARIQALCAENGAAMLRLGVDGGGCSGFQYIFGFESKPMSDDHVFEHNGAKIVIDDMSIGLLSGSTLDFIDGLSGSHFKVNNPRAASSCGCGTSFSI